MNIKLIDPAPAHSEENVTPNKNVDKSLDEALKESFPSSDPIAITIEKVKKEEPEHKAH